jgi:small-conductance mechanosensitive channel/CRP-like cAMP-binding protein
MGDWRVPARRSAAVLLLALGLELLAGQLALRGLHQAAVLVLGLVLIHLGGLVFFRVLLPALHGAAPRILEDVAVFCGYVLWGLVRLSEAGVELSGLVATSAVITAVLAFAMQDTLGNVLGGLALQLDDSFEIGDWLKLDDVSGRVVQIQWRFTALLTRNGERVVVPNGQLMKAKFSVITGAAGPGAAAWRRWVEFPVDYQVPPTQVIAAAERAVSDAAITNVAGTPPPSCVALAFSPGAMRYALRYWLQDPRDDDATDSAVRCHLLAALQRQGWRIALPDQAVHVVQDSAAQRDAAWQRELARREQALAAIDLFAPLDAGERRHIAEHLAHAPFVQGDVMTRQGAVAHWLYIIASGEAEVVLEGPDGTRRTLKRLPAGSLFGEMGLMTGAPRSATVVAATDVECYRLDKAGFEHVIRGRHEIAEGMSHILAQRQHENEALRDAQRQAPAEPVGHGAAILARMREFFGLG